MVQAGRKRSTGDRSPERNSDEDLDIMEDVHSVVAAVHAERGAEQRVLSGTTPRTSEWRPTIPQTGATLDGYEPHDAN
ncbi:unnamed protein product [Heligmosomoides polygyrus]|uniref:Transposase n=1 Tax=Heligmosomoides polygyrus TaxID=6339 RepID=A0A183FCW2_HELPZ|nr:unnamed protein product [Heligmosomoides polygyrus]